MNKYTFKKNSIPDSLTKMTQEEVMKSDGYLVNSYEELSKHIAELACANPNVILFFRGQGKDYMSGGIGNMHSSLLPTIYRKDLSAKEKNYKIRQLETAGKILSKKLKDEGVQNAAIVGRKRMIQWSILQHYEVVDTPLIDVTQSLRVACSFAMLNNNSGYAYIYVIALPYYTNRISVNSEEYITNIRLLSIMPPEALRPYYQEGFLIGEDEYSEDIFEQKEEKDLSRRLLYKFKISTENLSQSDENWLNEARLMPQDDKMRNICEEVKKEVASLSFGDDDGIANQKVGEFLLIWQPIEKILNEYLNVRDKSGRYNLVAAINQIEDKELAKKLQRLRTIRNRLVHEGLPQELNVEDLLNSARETDESLKRYLNNLIRPTEQLLN